MCLHAMCMACSPGKHTHNGWDLHKCGVVRTRQHPFQNQFIKSNYDQLVHVCTWLRCTCPCRLKEGETKKKRRFQSQSMAKKDRLKYYELILKRLEEFM